MGDGGQVIVDAAPVSTGREALAASPNFLSDWLCPRREANSHGVAPGGF